MLDKTETYTLLAIVSAFIAGVLIARTQCKSNNAVVRDVPRDDATPEQEIWRHFGKKQNVKVVNE